MNGIGIFCKVDSVCNDDDTNIIKEEHKYPIVIDNVDNIT